MKQILFSLFVIFFINLNAQTSPGCYTLYEECGGAIFTEPNQTLCKVTTCPRPFPSTNTECKPVVNGISCGFSDVQNGQECNISWYLQGFYGAIVPGNYSNDLIVKRWLAKAIRFNNKVMDSKLVVYEPDPLDSYYNFSSAPELICQQSEKAIDFMGHQMPNTCLKFEVYRTNLNQGHPRDPAGSILSSMTVPYSNVVNLNSLLNTSLPLNTDLIIKIRSFCCNSVPMDQANKTKYIYIRMISAPSPEFQFVTSSLGDGLINSGPGDVPTDNLENISTSINNPIVLSPFSCGVFIGNYNSDPLYGKFKMQIWRLDNCTGTPALILETPYKNSTDWPAFIGFNSEFSPAGYFALNYLNGSLFGKCYKFIMVAENQCAFAQQEAYFKFTPEVYALKGKDEKYFPKSTVANYFTAGQGTEVDLSPNPFSGMLQISNVSLLTKLEIIGSDGVLVKELNQKNIQAELDLNELNSGIYFFKTTITDGSTKIQKLIKM